MFGCLLWFVGVGAAVSAASQGQWLLAIGLFIGTQVVCAAFSPRSREY